MKSKTDKLPKAFKNKWIKALRSGDYKQGKLKLYNKEFDSYCCLGVAAYLCGVRDFKGLTFIKKGIGLRGISKIPDLLKGDSGIPKGLASMNDRGYSFDEIAGYIKENL